MGMTVQEYNECVKRFSDDVYRFVLSNMKFKEDAQDVIQNTFEVLWMNKANVEVEKAKSYLFSVAFKKVIDLVRKRKRITFAEEIPDQLGGSVETKFTDLKKVLHRALDALPDNQKQLVLLKDYEGCSYQELANITGMNESQVKVYLHRARTQLKKTLISVNANLA
jgi:RNA polymerase sigma factor (sigma-70 family)